VKDQFDGIAGRPGSQIPFDDLPGVQYHLDWDDFAGCQALTNFKEAR
jgi:hypothetical protein